MTDKDPREAVTSYITDMLALEQHISKALEGQVQDLKAIFAFLKSLPAISNAVPDPISPTGERIATPKMLK